MAQYKDRRTMSDEEKEKRRRFLQRVLHVCRTEGYSISHEDGHGAFLVEPVSDDLLSWLGDADYGLYNAPH